MSSSNTNTKQSKVGRSRKEVEAFLQAGNMLDVSKASTTAAFSKDLLPEKGAFSTTTETTRKNTGDYIKGTSTTDTRTVINERFAELSNLTDEQLATMAELFEARRQDILRRKLQPGRSSVLVAGETL